MVRRSIEIMKKVFIVMLWGRDYKKRDIKEKNVDRKFCLK